MNIVQYIQAQNLTDQAFAQLVGASFGAVKKWRYAERMPSRKQMKGIGEATGGQVTYEDCLAYFEAGVAQREASRGMADDSVGAA